MQHIQPFRTSGSPVAAGSSYADVVRSHDKAAKGLKVPMNAGPQHSHTQALRTQVLRARASTDPFLPATARLVSKLNPEAAPFEPSITRRKMTPTAALKPSTSEPSKEASAAEIRTSEADIYAAIVQTTSFVAAATAPLAPAGQRSLTFVEVVRA